MIWDLLIAVVPAVILFLYGIENFSEEVRHAAGERFRTILQNATKTSLRGALAGAAVTALVQSSTATTIIAVGLVNAGAISFLASLGLVIGANVGTTLTAQLVAFKLTAQADAAQMEQAVQRLQARSGADWVVHNDLARMVDGRHPFTVFGRDGRQLTCEGPPQLAAVLVDILIETGPG